MATKKTTTTTATTTTAAKMTKIAEMQIEVEKMLDEIATLKEAVLQECQAVGNSLDGNGHKAIYVKAGKETEYLDIKKWQACRPAEYNRVFGDFKGVRAGKAAYVKIQ